MTKEEMREEACRLYFEDGSKEACGKAEELFRQLAAEEDIISAAYLGGIATDAGDYPAAKEWWGKTISWYSKDKPEEAQYYASFAHAQRGKLLFYNHEGLDPVPDFYRPMAYGDFCSAREMGNTDCLEELGVCYYEDGWMPGCAANPQKALEIWKEGMDKGDQRCALRYCAHYIDIDDVDEKIIDILNDLIEDEKNPCADACALLYQYFHDNGEEELAESYKKEGLEMGSELLKGMLGDEEVADGTPCVIVVDTDGVFRIVNADASDWESLPAIIDAERTDNMRCEKFRNVSRALGLKGTLLGLLDRDAFRKPDLELNWHASQWYDGMADLAGDMIVCMEDSRYNPISFASEEEAQRVIDALRK